VTGLLATVVVLNFNGAHLLPDCLDGLAAQDLPEGRMAVWVVDNASSDGSMELLADQFPWVRAIANDSNDGFAGGNNLALREVATPFVALINNDARPEPDWLRQWRLLRSPEVPYHLRTEAVVTEEDVADPGHQYISAHPGSLRSSPRWTPETWSGPTPSSLASFPSMSCAGCSSAGDAWGPRAVSAGSGALGSSSRTGPVAPATFAPSFSLSLWSSTSALSRRPSYGGMARPPVSGLLPPVNGSELICSPSS